ncbi:MAG: ABC transporter ATP-binding protein [Streptococcaceae bacterium]|jgi:putative ABC transport system ATP-binding protein|nr:ABC transporter ATP-binding protein [Streptococcaceae bacterium]
MIELEKVTKAFGEKIILKDFDYKFENGKSYAVVGRSGSGKTTLLNIVGKLEKVDQGSVLIHKKLLSSIKEQIYFRDYVGYLFQNYGLIDNGTIEQNLDLAFVGKKRISTSKKRKIMLESLEKVHLNIDLKRKIYSLSGGEAQRIAIAKIIIKNPPIILADEPTASLDEQNTEEVIDLILNLLSEKKLLIVATHNPTVYNRMDKIVPIG